MLQLTPASVSYLTQMILLWAIVGYLGYHIFIRKSHHRKLHTLLFAGFITAGAMLGSLLFLESALPPAERIRVLYLENMALALFLLLLLQFAYHFPTLYPQRRLEAYMVLGLSILYLLFEIYWAISRFTTLSYGRVFFRAAWFDYPLFVAFPWVIVVFLRQTLTTARLNDASGGGSWLTRLWRSPATDVRVLRLFTGVSFITAFLIVAYLLRSRWLIPANLFQAVLSVGLLASAFLLTLAYLEFGADSLSFLVKLAGAVLVVILALFSLVSWSISTALAETYTQDLPLGHSLAFAPNRQGGYTLTPLSPQFEPADPDQPNLTAGMPLNLRSDIPANDVTVPFTFPFYGQLYHEIMIANNGAVGLGDAIDHWGMENNYGRAPAIYPLYLGNLQLQPPAAMLTQRVDDRLVITWQNIPQGDAVYTVQLVLYPDGRFQVNYRDLPPELTLYPDAHPRENVWLLGAVPGTGIDAALHPAPRPPLENFSQPVVGGPEGLIFDYYLAFRHKLHRIFAPLAWLMVFSSLVVLLGFPLLLRVNLVRPLNALLTGVRRVESGDYGATVPVLHQDEIGYLAGAFNRMAAQMSDLIQHLEARVAARTDDLQQANARLQTEMAEREQTHAQLLEQQRQLASLEARERLGRDLHDGLGQMMGYLNVQAQAVDTLLDQGHYQAARRNLTDLSLAARSAHQEIRAHILDLRPADTPRQDFLSAVRDYTQQFSRRYNLPVTCAIPDGFPAAPFNPAVEEQAIRILQEGLTNARRHAHADAVRVDFRQRERVIDMEISDNGRGFDPAAAPPEGHFGLTIMRERAVQAGGELHLHTGPGQGVRLVATLPAHRPNPGDDAVASLDGVRLLLVDDHPMFLQGLQTLLLARGFTVIGLAHSGPEAVQKCRDLRPDLVVMDLHMPNGDGLDATRLIKAEFPAIKVVILTVSADENDLFEAIKNGASGFLLKSLDATQFCDQLIGLMQGDTALAPGLSDTLLTEFARLSAAPTLPPADKSPLSAQQLEILGMVVDGLTYKEIGRKLHLNLKTIQYHMAQIQEKLALENRKQAIAWYKQQYPPA